MQSKSKEKPCCIVSDVKSRNSVLPRDSLETVFRCLGLGLDLGGWCLGNGNGNGNGKGGFI